MPLTSLDHVNVRTGNLDAMIAWYVDILGMTAGDRPDFPFRGAWLYISDHPAVHLVEVATPPDTQDPRIEHYAFGAKDLRAFIAKLTERGIAHSLDPVPGFPIVQVNLHDPDGNHIHVDFARDEAEGLL